MAKSVQEAVETRYSARYFDKDKKIDKKDLDLIINAGLKAPSGFSSEPWKFFIIEGDRQKIFKSCMEQQPILDASELIVIAYIKKGYLTKHPEFYDKFAEAPNFRGKSAAELLDGLVTTNYFKEQIPYAAMQMVLQATSIGIDNLIMSGFEEDSLLKDLGLDKEQYGLSVVLAFGYNTKPATIHGNKRGYDEVVSKIKL